MDFEKRGFYKWFVLCLAFSFMLVLSLLLQSLPPILDNITKDVPLSHSQAGLLMGAYSVLGIFVPPFMSFFLNKYDIKKIIILSLTAIIVGLIGFSLSSSYTLLLANRLLSGVGAGVMGVLSPILVTKYFDKKQIGTAMGIFNTAVPIGTVISSNLFVQLSLHMSWRIIVTGIAIFAAVVLAAVIFFLVSPSKGREEINPHKEGRLKPSTFNLGLNFTLMAIMWLIANGQLVVYTTFGPGFFKLSGQPSHMIGLLTGMIMLLSIFLTPIMGIIIDRTQQKKAFLFGGLIVIAVAFFYIVSSSSYLLFWSIVLGIGFAPISVSTYSLLTDIIRPDETEIAYIILALTANLGIAIGPAGFGSILDLTNENYFLGFVLLSMLSLLCALLVWGIRPKR